MEELVSRIQALTDRVKALPTGSMDPAVEANLTAAVDALEAAIAAKEHEAA